ncbi:L-glutaminase [Novosphingobium sp. PhB165]|uniref:glutaminase A n=1 Tax=Novosphingobium sp. PhB165 TaxID=2485105 RepID=UPI00104899DA|nr:glutaminase A [Novosphingobium sp. PhB165]TCM20617.1 L-glutaminase [Novosphingobium sp. PhB165]
MEEEADTPFVSTGHLPPSSQVQRLIERSYDLFRHNDDGACSQTYPALARVPRELFGLCMVGTDGSVHAVGDADHDFTIMSVSKPFVFALVCQQIGPAAARDRIGVNATGFPFNSVVPFDMNVDGRTNPMVNSGAIATTSLVPGATAEAKWAFVLDGLSAFAGRELALNAEVLACARETNLRNRGIAQLLHSNGRVYCDPMEALDIYTMQCALDVTARDIAVMGATLADGGVNPVTRRRVVDQMTCHYTLAVMATAGLYETSGDWLYEIGLPGKSGIGGGLVAVSPGKGGLGTFSPLLDPAGNSVRGQLAAKYLSGQLGMDLFLSSGPEN